MSKSGRIDPNDLPFLADGGAMGSAIRAFDWSATPLGEPAGWPQPLRTLVNVMIGSRQPMFITWGRARIMLYNDGYAPMLGGRHPSALGRPFAEVWFDILADVEPILDRAYAGEGTHMDDIAFVMHRHGYPEEAHFAFSYTPVRDEAGEVAGMFCACTETTGEVRARARLREEKERLTELFRQAPGFMAVLRGPEHVFELTNAAYQQLVGTRDVVGKPIREALPDVEGQGFYELLDRVYRTGEAYVGRMVPITLQHRPGGPTEDRFVDFIYQPITDADGTVGGIFVEGSDVTDRKRAQDYQRLLINELNHRVKNTLAMVQAIATQSFRPGESPARSREAFTSRIVALAQAHDVLTRESWEGADLADIVAGALRPFEQDGQARFAISGPPVRLAAKTALSFALAIHELATNAAKYGALSAEGGRVDLAWEASGAGADRPLRMTWRETGGPPVSAPARKGFGSRLIERGLAAELNGEVRIAFEPGGVVCTIDARLRDDAGEPAP